MSSEVAKVAARWKELDEVRGDELAKMRKAQEHLEEVGDELGVNPPGQLITYDLFKDMLNGKFLPTFGLGDVLTDDYHKGFTCIRCTLYTPREIQDHAREQKTCRMSNANSRYDEANDIIAKKGKALPDNYQGVCAMVAGF